MLLVNLPQDKKSKTLKGKAFRHKLNIAKCIKPDVRFCPSSESKMSSNYGSKVVV